MRRLLDTEWSRDIADEVIRVGCRLCLEYSVDRPDEGYQIVHGLITLRGREPRMLIFPLELIEDDVPAFVFPVIFEDVLEQRAQLLLRGDGFGIVA